MTTSDLVIEVLVTAVSKAVLAICVVALIVTMGAIWWRGRGEQLWPDEDEGKKKAGSQ